MNLKIVLAAAALTFATAGAALARDVVTAKLETPLAQKEKVIAASLVWQCEGDSCVTISRNRATARVCRQLAREVGRIVAFGAEEEKLADADLTTCNESARVRTAAQ